MDGRTIEALTDTADGIVAGAGVVKLTTAEFLKRVYATVADKQAAIAQRMAAKRAQHPRYVRVSDRVPCLRPDGSPVFKLEKHVTDLNGIVERKTVKVPVYAMTVTTLNHSKSYRGAPNKRQNARLARQFCRQLIKLRAGVGAFAAGVHSNIRSCLAAGLITPNEVRAMYALPTINPAFFGEAA